MRRTLVITADPAWPPISGADLRNWQNAATLARLGPVILASVHPARADAPKPPPEVSVVALTEAGEKRGPALTINGTSIDVVIPESALARLLAIVAASPPDAILIEGIGLFPVVAAMRPMAPLLILDMHNVQSDLVRQTASNSLIRRMLGGPGRDATRIRALELSAAQTVDRLWVCSEQDEERLHGFVTGNVPISIVPNGVPRAEAIPPALGPAPPASGDWPIILFVGHLNYRPNVIGVKRLANAILPKLRLDLPHVSLVVAGRRPSSKLARLAVTARFKLIANPVDTESLLAKAHVTVIPLTVGGGTRLKILEAMSRGVPVVATRLAVEGLGVVDGVHALIADTSSGMVDGVRALCADPEYRDRIRVAAHRFAMDRFGPRAIEQAVHAGISLCLPIE